MNIIPRVSDLRNTDEVELKLDEADKAATPSEERYSGEEVFERVRGCIHRRKVL